MIQPALDHDFIPAALYNKAFSEKADEAFYIALERDRGLVYRYDAKIIRGDFEHSCFYIERLIKTILWSVGGFRLTLCGDEKIGRYIADCYKPGGLRQFDSAFMSKVYERQFETILTSKENLPERKDNPAPVGRHLDGCRIGFDAGGSDMKVSAVTDGKVIFSQEIVWHPKRNDNPDYHYAQITQALQTAAAKLPRVDAVGVSSAGVYVNNRAMAASLFIKIPPEAFDARIKDIYINAAKTLGDIPVTVANDGDVAALSGAMYSGKNGVLGVAMGTSEAGGYVDGNGNVTGWLNELAFVPADYNTGAAVDEWSGDFGCGVKYFSQDAVIRLAPRAGIALSEKLSPAEKLKEVQTLAEANQGKARLIFETIGVYLGYAVAHYADFYDINYLQLLGRVTSGVGGDLLLREANAVLQAEFPALAQKITLYMPDEYERRVGQSIAAASLPQTKAR
ncbi:MAG: ROK family protein [Clostridiales bacterium]|jgi:predicted NBD/HSP70 family sugar kinase|nr:ROK family protein [Clostridiales bacterium]